MKINNEKLKKEAGLYNLDESDLLDYISAIIEQLATHNKNYTKDQYQKILLLQSIINSLEA